MSTNFTAKKPKFVGVIRPTMFSNLGNPKRLLLMFDALVMDLSYRLPPYENKIINHEDTRDEIDYLSDEGLLTTLGGLEASYGSNNNSPNMNDFWVGKDLAHQINTFGRVMGGVSNSSKLFGNLGNSPSLRNEYDPGKLRYTASNLRLNGIDAVAIPTEEELTI